MSILTTFKNLPQKGGAPPAGAHAGGGREPSRPWGRGEAARGECPLPLGRADHTRAGLVETLAATGQARAAPAQGAGEGGQRHRDHGPARRGGRTPLRHCRGPCVAHMGQPRP